MENKYTGILESKNLSLNEKAVFLILNNLASNGVIEGYSLIELSTITNITKPTLLKVLNNLEEKGFLKKNKHDGKYAKNTYKIQ